MAKLGKLTKLKSAIKRFPSFSKRSSSNSNNNTLSRSNTSLSSTSSIAAVSAATQGQNLRPVYVGQSRRRYLVSPDIIHHPVFQELVDRSAASGSGPGPEDGVLIACEVVLFEHLLWMLESEESQLGSMDELVDFYACA